MVSLLSFAAQATCEMFAFHGKQSVLTSVKCRVAKPKTPPPLGEFSAVRLDSVVKRKSGDRHSFTTSRTEVYDLNLMLLVEISNTHGLELARQVVPFVTMK